ncbi:hypothetical protein PseudUWO311_21090 [Pseudanabaena sp. UWO311]|uniref:hypothetical protein n=1 Tax=Pseudanabaena sp. UWO311 TaxID=2487337 RepID=UPI00115706E1|nr:hypothetical protein [Pseudanabaena sp. UWO311]TYQ23923.1 hypothetical protein PseudUWO311_21090 [Pseudanabaena sp. UWO311]
MKTFPFPQILVSFLTMSTLLAFTPSKAEAYGDRECQFTIENSTNQVIDSLYIVPSSAEKTHSGWKINRLDKPLQVGGLAMINVQTTPDALYWNAFGIFDNKKPYVFLTKDLYNRKKYIWDYLSGYPPCDGTWTLEDYEYIGNWNW